MRANEFGTNPSRPVRTGSRPARGHETQPLYVQLDELSTELLGRYKKAASADAKKADAEGDYARGDKRFKGINRATNKQFDNDLKKHNQQGVAEGESAREKWNRASAEREKKHNDAEKEMKARHARGEEDMKGSIDRLEKHINAKEGWSQKYKSSINCSHPKGFSQKAHCAGKKKHNESIETEMTCPDCGMCQTHGSLNEIKKGAKDSNGFTKCWSGYHAAGTKKGKNGKPVRNCVPNESMAEAIARLEAELEALAEEGKASRKLCASSKPDSELGASQLSSCKSQGLRSRDGNKSHKLGKSPKSRVKVGGHKIKGQKYGGPLPDWS